MKNELDLHLCLRVFDRIRQQGCKRQNTLLDTYDFEGMTATSDYDGYEVTIENRDVTAIIRFHNAYDLHYSSQDAVTQFISQLKRLDKSILPNDSHGNEAAHAVV